MGGKGSRSYPEAGRPAKAAINVAGTGAPEMPIGLPEDVQREWHRLVGLTSGVTFSQDSDALLEAAEAVVEGRVLSKQLKDNIQDSKEYGRILRDRLAVRRSLFFALGRLGLTPRDRQMLLVPRKDESREPSRLERIRQRREA